MKAKFLMCQLSVSDKIDLEPVCCTMLNTKIKRCFFTFVHQHNVNVILYCTSTRTSVANAMNDTEVQHIVCVCVSYEGQI